MVRPLTKLFLDSRYAISRSSKGAVVDFALDGPVELRPEMRCFLSELTCVVAWRTIDETNRDLYVIENGTYRLVQLSTGTHDMGSLVTDIQTKLNGAGKDAGMGTYTVTRVGNGGTTAASASQYFDITCSAGTFKIPSTAQIVTLFGVPEPATTNTMFSFPEGDVALGSHTSRFVDLRRSHSVYVHSPSFGAYNTMAPRGVRTVLAKVPVDVGFGGLVQWRGSLSEHDCVEVGVRCLNTLTLELRDVAGRELDLNGTAWSATILFEL